MLAKHQRSSLSGPVVSYEDVKSVTHNLRVLYIFLSYPGLGSEYTLSFYGIRCKVIWTKCRAPTVMKQTTQMAREHDSSGMCYKKIYGRNYCRIAIN